MPSPPRQNQSFANTSKKVPKNSDQTLPAAPAPNTPQPIADTPAQQAEAKNVKTVEVEKYAVMKQNLLPLLLKQFTNNHQEPRKNSNP